MSADEGSAPSLGCATLLTPGRRVPAPAWTELESARQSGQVLWLDVERPDEADLRRLARVFGLHDEMVEDSRLFRQRTRLVDYAGYLLVVMHAVAGDAATMLEVHLYVTPRAVISIRSEPCPPLELVRDHSDKAVGATTTVPALLSRILATLVGTFSDALDLIDDELTELEGRVIADALAPGQLEQLLAVRRRVNTFRRAVDPARDLVGAGRYVVIDALEDVAEDARRHLRDLAVDLARVSDQLEGERDRLSAVMDVYMNQVNNRQNRIMQQLAAVSTVFLPLTFLTGYFGMNFASMVRGVDSAAAFVLLGGVVPLAVLVAALVLVGRRGWFRGG